MTAALASRITLPVLLPYQRANFFDKIVVAENGCHIWIGAVSGEHGNISIYRRTYLAHRMAWLLEYDEDPGEQLVCHKCPTGSNPLCVNPEHLYLGDFSDNARDKFREGRESHKGEGNAFAKLTDQIVTQIYLEPFLYKDSWIAKKYGVCTATISNIRMGRSWTHITEKL